MSQPAAAPFEGHVYLDHHRPPILWNIARGGFNSVGMLPETGRNFAISVSLASMLQNSSLSRLQSEVAIERVRQTMAPGSVSRLTGLFVFDEVESLAQIWESDQWEGGHFTSQYLADVGVVPINSSRVDANWISEIMGADCSLTPNWEAAACNYWQGVPHPQRAPIWERIVEGFFTVWSMHSRQAALEEIAAIWPDSTGLLTHSMNCLAAGSLDGQCFPGLTVNGDQVTLDYYLRLVDTQTPDLISRIERVANETPRLYAGRPELTRMATPDLSGYSISIPATQGGICSSLAETLLLTRSGMQPATDGSGIR